MQEKTDNKLPDVILKSYRKYPPSEFDGCTDVKDPDAGYLKTNLGFVGSTTDINGASGMFFGILLPFLE